MRPTAKKQSALQTPLNDVLGTEACVRVLRALSLSSLPLSRGEIARETSLHVSGLPRVLERLENLGVIEAIGRGRARPIQLRAKYPVAAQIRALFAEERNRAERVEQNIQAAFQGLSPRPDAAWIEGDVATGSDTYESPIVIGVLMSGKVNEQWEHQLRAGLLQIQSRDDVAIELRIRRRADVETARPSELETLRHVRSLFGPPPLDLLGLSEPGETQSRASRFNSHGRHDINALEYARAVAQQLKTKPDMVDEALRFIERRQHAASEGEQLTLREWRDILTSYSLGRLRKFLVSDSERAIRLRQSLPIFAAKEVSHARTRRQPRKP